MIIRLTTSNDIPALQQVLDGTELFPSDMLPDMLAGFLTVADSPNIWLTCEDAGQPVGFCYAVPEDLADGTWNMLAIAVLPSCQGRGFGGAVVQHLEDVLRGRRARILIADTSGTDEFAQTRAFYQKSGYAEEARIRDFWAAGDDKVVFWKSLTD
ncbi:GNAT family N-acetyltransferase [Parasulfitobacter algicola]|uniref:GNAT family N-acetyltransferase n=1 Tax=Parasulfitobacter algicola TaxID=2614809 RepID=A0ABX2IQS1_9RHOB|nr:GNAT family N-acetyltransferase [Sulfitobacter algicola]NSX54371.1 GNAT family N-acetyltransferase [Sulfitobacter algicola]